MTPTLKGRAARQVSVTVRLELRPALSRATVVRAIEDSGLEHWSIEDITQRMGERDYRVRAAIGWLIHQGRVGVTGERIRVNEQGRHYAVALYTLLDEKKPTNWAGLATAMRWA